QTQAEPQQGQDRGKPSQETAKNEKRRPANTLIYQLDMARLDVMENFHGILFPGHLHTQDSLQYALKFPFQDTDILIVSYPKSGTTWMQEILTLICSKGDPHLSQTVPNWTRAPWLEHFYCPAVLEASSTTHRVITTHMPHHLLGPALQGTKAKIIYVSRNPKDVVVSFYHFHKMANFFPENGPFPEFLNRFLEGTVPYGSWFDHFKGWTSQIATMNLLHMTYEEMSLDLYGAIKRVSAFLTISPGRGRGKVGDWKNMFTEEQNQYFKSVFKSKMQDCTLEFVWEEEVKEESGDMLMSKSP
ncbi:hypothetical protein L3Q82_008744, partial [Scortum barcoo]